MDKSGNKSINKKKIILRIVFWVSMVLFVIGGFVLYTENDKMKTEYSIDRYGVEKDYKYVYDKYSGEIIDDIELGERCEVLGDKIIVRKTGESGLYVVGYVITLSSPSIIICIIVYWIEDKIKSKKNKKNNLN